MSIQLLKSGHEKNCDYKTSLQLLGYHEQQHVDDCCVPQCGVDNLKISCDNGIAIGYGAGAINQSPQSVAIGCYAGYSDQSNNAIAIGYSAGQASQGGDAVAIGINAGQTNQGGDAVAIGINAGQSNQGSNAVAIGINAGQTNQGSNAVAIGGGAGILQNVNAVAIGYAAGTSNQGTNAIAIGAYAGRSNIAQASQSIVLDAGAIPPATTGLTPQSSGFFVRPVASTTSTSNVLVFNIATNEIRYSTAVKTFVIPHPIHADKYLQHACLEGPEAGVYYRGTAQITNDAFTVIQLPEYVDKIAKNLTVHVNTLVDFDDEKTHLLNHVVASTVKDGKFKVFGKNSTFNWVVYGERHPIVVEPTKAEYELKGDGPYTYLARK